MAGESRKPVRPHIMLQGLEKIRIVVVPGLKGMRVKPGPEAEPVAFTRTRAGIRLGGKHVEGTIMTEPGEEIEVDLDEPPAIDRDPDAEVQVIEMSTEAPKPIRVPPRRSPAPLKRVAPPSQNESER